MKKLIFLFIVVMGVAFTSCDKSKTCSCKSVVKTESDSDLLTGVDAESTQTGTISDGECSDLSEQSTSSMGSMTMTTTTTCVEI